MTRTPVWLLWGVAMMPIMVLTLWTVIFQGQQMPTSLVVLMLVLCLGLYLYLIQRGRIVPRSRDREPEPSTIDSGRAPIPVAEPVPDAQPAPPVLRPINKEEEGQLQTCFPWTIYYLRQIEYHPQSVVCRGQLRTTPENAYQVVRDNVAAQFGDRFHVVFQAGQDQPFFELVTNPAANLEGKSARQLLTRPGLAVALAVITLITTTWAGLQRVGRVPTFPAILEDGLPYSLSLMVFFAVRGFANYFIARNYQIATSLPYFIPVIPLPFLPLGTIGAFTHFRSPIPNRKALLDMALVAPFLGLCVCIPLLAWGLTHSEVVLLPEQAGLFQFQALNPRFSIALAGMAKLAIGKDLVPQSALQLDPIAAAGWVGLVFTAFNLMPIGQLDGGRAIHAVFGQRAGARIGRIARFLLLGFAFVHPHLLLWAILLLLLPVTDEPALNDVTPVDSFRDMVGLLALAILILLVMPAPRFLTAAMGM